MPRVARLNERVAHKEEIHHPELTIAFWQAVPGVLARETPAPAGDRRWRFEGRRVVDGRELLVRVVVEADKDTGYAVVVSGHYTTKRSGRRAEGARGPPRSATGAPNSRYTLQPRPVEACYLGSSGTEPV